jgi:hypothetical protein
MIGNWNPQITSGGGWSRTLIFTQDGAAYNLTGATATMSLTPAGGTATSPTVSINGSAGTVTVSLTSGQVAAIDWSGVVNSLLTISQTGGGEAIVLSGIATLV